MGTKALSHNRDIFIDKTPDLVYLEYFETLQPDKAVYTAVIIDENQKPSLFIEGSGGSRTSRIFFRKKDALKYVSIVESAGISQGLPVKMWQSPAEIVTLLLIQLEKHGTDKTKQLQGVASYFVGKDLIDIDIFWTKNQRIIC